MKQLLVACKKGEKPEMGRWGSLPLNGQVSCEGERTLAFRVFFLFFSLVKSYVACVVFFSGHACDTYMHVSSSVYKSSRRGACLGARRVQLSCQGVWVQNTTVMGFESFSAGREQ